MTDQEAKEMTSQPPQPEEQKPAAAPRKSFWSTLPGVLTGIAALMTAVGGLLTALISGGVLKSPAEPTPTIVTATPTTAAVVELRVLFTTPQDGAVDVDPALTEIVVVFSGPMRQDSWSFTAVEGVESPPPAGDPRFTDPQTCVLPVRLEAGKTYGIGINSPTRKGFVSARDNGVAAEPYRFTFTTAP